MKYTIKYIHELASEKGGKCLSTEYKNCKQILLWRCKKGHLFEKSLEKVIYRASWCPECSIRRKITIEDMKILARDRGGRCLSKSVKNATDKLTWQCSESHKWKATPNSVKDGPKKRGSWCPKCSGNTKKSISDVKKIVEDSNIKLISKSYKDAHSKLKLYCRKHKIKFEKSLSTINRSSNMCPECRTDLARAKNSKYTLDDLNSYAIKKGGRCTSTKYINLNTKYKWSCEYGHEWLATANSVFKHGTWCPSCSASQNEEICRAILNETTSGKFSKAKPKYLDGMEFDGLDINLRIAFEYHGIQHYQYNSFFHKSKADFNKRVKDDKRKEKLAHKNHIRLIVIPHNKFEGKDIISQIKYIKKRIKEIAPEFKTNEVLAKDIQTYSPKQNNYIKRCKYISTLNKGSFKLLNNKYISPNKTQITWICKKGHEWNATLAVTENGKWCKECLGKWRKINLSHAINLAKSKKGKCISKEYSGTKAPLSWECQLGHRWEATFDRVNQGSWCPRCARNAKVSRKQITDKLKVLNYKHDLKNLKNLSQKLNLTCPKGHNWNTTAAQIYNGIGKCPYCNRVKIDINEAHSLAKSKHGKCLSKSFKDSKTKLKWECQNGHIWESIFSSILNGHWCNKCSSIEAGKRRRVETLNKLQKIANYHHGRITSKEFKAKSDKLNCICKEKHRFKLSYYQLKRGTWCPMCCK